jgi:predicted ATPase
MPVSCSLKQLLVEHLRLRRLLLVLDYSEHLLEVCAGVADALLRDCPGSASCRRAGNG